MAGRHVVAVYYDHHWYADETFKWRWQAALAQWMINSAPNDFMGRYEGRHG